MRALRQAVDETAAARGRTVLLSGDAGIGKSRLVAETAAYAQSRGLRVVGGVCFPRDQTCPYALFLDLLRARYAGCTRDEIAALVGPFARELHPLLPDIIPPVAGADPVLIESELARRRRSAAISQATLGPTTESPLLIVTEDLHWCDESSLDLLHGIARESRRRPVMILGTFRTDETHPQLVAWLAGLSRERLATEIALNPLGPDDVSMMVTAIAADTSVPAHAVDRLIELADGNPFYVEELLGSWFGAIEKERTSLPRTKQDDETASWPLSRSIWYGVRERCQHVSAGAQTVLRLAAIIGRRFDLMLLERIADVDEHMLLSLIKELISAHLVVEESRDRFTFRHAIIRQAIYEDLLGRERMSLHRAVAEEAERLYAGAIDHHAADLAYHFAEAEVWQKALLYARRAGERARTMQAPRLAIDHFGRALTAVERLHERPSSGDEGSGAIAQSGLYRERARAYEQLGEFDAARTDYDAAVAQAREVGDRRTEWQVLTELGLLWARRDYARAGPYLQEALDLARTLAEPRLFADGLNRVGNWRVNAAEPHQGLPLHREALAIAERLDDRCAIAETVDLLGVGSYFAGDLPSAVAWYDRAIALFRELNDQRGLVTSLAILVFLKSARDMLPLTLGFADVKGAVREGEESVALARSIEWPAGEAFALFQLAVAPGAAGDYDPALAHAERGLHIAEEIGHQQWRTLGHCTLGVLYLDLLAFQPALAHLQRMVGLGREIASSFWVQYGGARLAVAYLMQGDVHQADAVLAAGEADPGTGALSLAGWWLCYAEARRAAAARDPTRALSILEGLAPAAGDGRRERDTPLLAVARAEALAALGRRGDAEATLVYVQDSLHRGRAHSLLWRGYVALGNLHRAQGRDEDARREFAAARLVIEEIAGRLLNEALRSAFLKSATNQLPGAYRLSPRRSLTTRFGGLTEREREVAVLVARGCSNREIAIALVLGRRTVETHVANALAKLGATSRQELAAWAIEQGLVHGAR